MVPLMTYETFRACDDLDAEDFKNFSRQYTNELANSRRRLIDARNTAKRAADLAQSTAASINRLKADARRHGVELPE
jgi:uncharacterized protein YeaO (DUF488 family)